MTENSVWTKSQKTKLQIAEHIRPGFDIGFDKQIPQGVKDELRRFVQWVESNYRIPITLWVDFKYKHHLFSRERKKAGFLFYWADFPSSPVFDDEEAIPHIVLPVRTERSTFEELLASFIEAIDYYFAWICNEISDGHTPNYDEVEEILQAYLRHRYADRTFSFGTLSSILEEVPDRYCIEIEFRLKDHPKYCSCWMGNTVDEGKASFWYGLVPDGSEAYDYTDLASFSSAPVFDGKTLEEVWDQIELISIDSCDPIERVWMLL